MLLLCFLKDSDLSELKHKEHHSRQRWEWLEELGEREEKRKKEELFTKIFNIGRVGFLVVLEQFSPLFF
jgi:hypothetical protein